MKRYKKTPQPKVQKDLYVTASGLGGAFDVIVIQENGEAVDVQVYMPRNLDWHGYRFPTKKAALRSANQKVLVAA